MPSFMVVDNDDPDDPALTKMVEARHPLEALMGDECPCPECVDPMDFVHAELRALAHMYGDRIVILTPGGAANFIAQALSSDIGQIASMVIAIDEAGDITPEQMRIVTLKDREPMPDMPAVRFDFPRDNGHPRSPKGKRHLR